MMMTEQDKPRPNTSLLCNFGEFCKPDHQPLITHVEILCSLDHISPQLARAVLLKAAQTCSAGALILAAEDGELTSGKCFCKQPKDPLLGAWTWPDLAIAASGLRLATSDKLSPSRRSWADKFWWPFVLWPLICKLSHWNHNHVHHLHYNKTYCSGSVPFLSCFKLSQKNQASCTISTKIWVKSGLYICFPIHTPNCEDLHKATAIL